MTRRILVAGNWKMNGLTADLDFFSEVAETAAQSDAEVLVCPPATLLGKAAAACQGGPVKLGGQDCHAAENGAHTGDISAEMLRDAGASHVIVGHSERRADHGETSQTVRAKAEAALRAGLIPIICVGETLEERESARAETVVAEQLADSLPRSAAEIVIAYEPVWAIGTGKSATADDIAAMHAHIRGLLPTADATRILYGGSVKPANSQAILALEDVDGALIGGASLQAHSLCMIIQSVR